VLDDAEVALLRAVWGESGDDARAGSRAGVGGPS
jgi:hypothetical protein